MWLTSIHKNIKNQDEKGFGNGAELGKRNILIKLLNVHNRILHFLPNEYLLPSYKIRPF